MKRWAGKVAVITGNNVCDNVWNRSSICSQRVNRSWSRSEKNGDGEWYERHQRTMKIPHEGMRYIVRREYRKCQCKRSVNFVGAVICAKQALQLIAENREEGYIVNMSSTAGVDTIKAPDKHFNVYSPTKYAIRSLSETLAHELKDTKIRVSSINPGLVKTEISAAANLQTDFLHIVPSLTSNDIADAIMYIVGLPYHVRISELTIKPTNDVYD
ncbi:hypothetical protein TSAR_011580 [Trichomalopsis sarcophagae]|uniref:Dehydrogenase n=1 Tax=Trichomalopsis sarcophagae TaxID=543379 RepID=A0A232ETB7_9HYME|nr:hypothetical protein TSAR_011580 [Trichomalopsis sarcophagae]